MYFCDICGKENASKNTPHESCVKKLFGTRYMPVVNLSLPEVSLSAQKMAGKLSISGIQPKLSLKLNRRTKYLEVVQTGGEYILKPQIETFPDIPQNENTCMIIASHLGIKVPSHTLLKLKGDSWAYLVKRFDRIKEKKIHQEDFCQILGENNKYAGSVEQIGKKLKEVSEFPGLDAQLFFERVVLYFIIGNGDSHLKNFSIIYNEEGGIRLSPAYDIICSKLVIPDEEDFAITINGKKNKITRCDFDTFAKHLNINTKASYSRILDNADLIYSLIDKSRLDGEKKKMFKRIVKERYLRIM